MGAVQGLMKEVLPRCHLHSSRRQKAQSLASCLIWKVWYTNDQAASVRRRQKTQKVCGVRHIITSLNIKLWLKVSFNYWPSFSLSYFCLEPRRWWSWSDHLPSQKFYNL